MGPPGIVVPDHFGNVSLILQHCSDVDFNIARGTLVGNFENLSGNEHILTQEQVLEPAKMEQKFDARNKPLPKRMSPKE
jgi:hypothetical protein